MTDFDQARRTMLARQVRTADVTDVAVLRAIGAVPRELFVPEGIRPFAYSDADLRVGYEQDGSGRFLVEPAVLAKLVQLADIGQNDIVLDVGPATGYSSAVVSQIANSVVALESDSDLAAKATETLLELDIGNVAVVSGPLSMGYPAEGPYDVILVAGSVEAAPESLLEQLKVGGRMVAILGAGPIGKATLFRRTNDGISAAPAFDASAPSLPGFSKAKSFQF